MPTVSQQQINAICSTSTENESIQHISRGYWYRLNRRYWTTSDAHSKFNDLLFARALAILIWFYVVIIEFLGYNNLIKSSPIALNFLFNSAYSWKDISAIIYASGAAAYGISIEIYLIIPFIIVNSIFTIINCGMDHNETIDSITYAIKVIALFAGTELSHQNFKRFTYQQSYKLHYLTATRGMLRQSIYLTITIMFLVAPSLRAIYNATRLKCPYVYSMTNESNCNLIDLTRPKFGDTDPCVPDFTAMITCFEQLRIIRDIALLSIAFYSMYNKAVLDITGMSDIIHKILVTLFLTMSCSFIAANIDPFEFNRFRLAFNLIEIIITITVLVLLIINVRKNAKHQSHVIMEANPTIFG